MQLKFNKDNVTFYALGIFFLLLIFFIINKVSYFDPLNFCYIKIQGDIVRGEESSIHKAISLIKKEDKKAYSNLCKYVDTINENFCIVADWQISGPEFAEGLKLPGCYARGSKTIYLYPTKEISDTTINKRKNDIIKYAEFSKNFWQENN